MASTVETFCANYAGTHQAIKTLLLTGKTGCGKTKCARAVADWAMKTVKDFRPKVCVSWPELCADIDAKRGNGALEDLCQATLAVIDDIGAEHDPFGAHKATLCRVLSRRERFWTLITTNVEPSAWLERFGARERDRLYRNSRIVNLSSVPSFQTI